MSDALSHASGATLADQLREFTCVCCGEKHRYEYHGRRPPWATNVVFFEDVFLRRDPFLPPPPPPPRSRGGGVAAPPPLSHSPLCLGGKCTLCGETVCAAPQCGVYYAHRFCGRCLDGEGVLGAFPREIREAWKRHRSSGSRSPAAAPPPRQEEGQRQETAPSS